MEMQELQRLKNKYDIIGNDAGLNRALETAVAVAPTDLWGIKADKVVVTRYNGEISANNFADMLTRRGIKVYFHKPILGYPDNVDMVVSTIRDS